MTDWDSPVAGNTRPDDPAQAVSQAGVRSHGAHHPPLVTPAAGGGNPDSRRGGDEARSLTSPAQFALPPATAQIQPTRTGRPGPASIAARFNRPKAAEA